MHRSILVSAAVQTQMQPAGFATVVSNVVLRFNATPGMPSSRVSIRSRTFTVLVAANVTCEPINTSLAGPQWFSSDLLHWFQTRCHGEDNHWDTAASFSGVSRNNRHDERAQNQQKSNWHGWSNSRANGNDHQLDGNRRDCPLARVAPAKSFAARAVCHRI